MIEPTDEMADAFSAADAEFRRAELERLGINGLHLPTLDEGAFRAGLAAVLAIVERDYGIERRCPHGHPGGRRCGPCSFDAIERDHEERQEWAAMVAAEREDDES